MVLEEQGQHVEVPLGVVEKMSCCALALAWCVLNHFYFDSVEVIDTLHRS